MAETPQQSPLSLEDILAGIQSDIQPKTPTPIIDEPPAMPLRAPAAQVPAHKPKTDSPTIYDLDELLKEFDLQKEFPPQPKETPPVIQHNTRYRKPEKATSDKRGRKILSVISNIVLAFVCITLVVGSLLFAFSNDPDKSYFGFRIYNVLTKSMTPKEDGSSLPGGFKEGAVIIVKMCKPEDIKSGDIITFNPSTHDTDGSSFLTHRVIDIKTELNGKEGIFFVTQGDYNNSPDPPISGSMMVGKKVFHIPSVGDALQWIRTNFILAMIILVSFFVSIFFFRWYFAKPDSKKQNDESIPERRA